MVKNKIDELYLFMYSNMIIAEHFINYLYKYNCLSLLFLLLRSYITYILNSNKYVFSLQFK